tara:strand:+ start:5470 stop:5676 length:207 start_codon:yes stop_codon:yes gene_type:complete
MKINSKKYNKKLSSSKQGNSKKKWNEFDALKDEFFEEIDLIDQIISFLLITKSFPGRKPKYKKKLNEK